MKHKFKNIMNLFAVLLVIVLANCGTSEVTPAGPAITVTSTQFGSGTSYEATAADTIMFSYSVNAPGIYNNSKVDILINGSSAGNPFTHARASGATDLTFMSPTVNYIMSETLVGENIAIQIDAVDDLNQTSTVTLDITVVSAPVNTYTAVLLAAPLADKTSKTWFSTNLGTTISSASIVASTSNSADVDFGYYYSREANLSSPASYPSSVYDLSTNGQQWETLNNTNFRMTTITPEIFMSLGTYAEIANAFDTGTAETGLVQGLIVDQVIAFETNSNKVGGAKKGVLIVRNIVAGSGVNGRITIEIIVQK